MMLAMDPFLPDDSKHEAIRELLPSLASGIRLDTTVAGPPRRTGRSGSGRSTSCGSDGAAWTAPTM